MSDGRRRDRTTGGSPPAGDQALLDFAKLVRRLFWIAVVLAAVAVAGAVIQGLVAGLTFEVLVQWGALYAVVVVVVGAATIAVHALRGAGRARQRGERLSSEDVGLIPSQATERWRDAGRRSERPERRRGG